MIEQSTYQIGLKVLLSLSRNGDGIGWHRAKLAPELFKGEEVAIYQGFKNHIDTYSKLPDITTVLDKMPHFSAINCTEPPQYYLDLLNQRYSYDLLNAANVESQKIIAGDKSAVRQSAEVLAAALQKIREREYSTRLLDFGQDAGKLILDNYHQSTLGVPRAKFFWPYLDNMTNGAIGGDVVSVVGRPASGKSWMLFRTALKNWQYEQQDAIIVSMEMNALSVSQRLATMYTSTNLTQLKKQAYATPTYNKFVGGLNQLETEKAKLYVIDGNLAADPEDIYMLANQLGVGAVYIDGAYLLRSKNTRLNRFERVTESAESIKRYSGQLEIPSFASWQFNRDAVKKKAGQKGDTAGLENIGMSDSIGQLSSIVISLMQEESVETLETRLLTLLKGRDGEMGSWSINWLFDAMNFDQCESQYKQMDYI